MMLSMLRALRVVTLIFADDNDSNDDNDNNDDNVIVVGVLPVSHSYLLESYHESSLGEVERREKRERREEELGERVVIDEFEGCVIVGVYLLPEAPHHPRWLSDRSAHIYSLLLRRVACCLRAAPDADAGYVLFGDDIGLHRPRNYPARHTQRESHFLGGRR